jgi:hypothetical protein
VLEILNQHKSKKKKTQIKLKTLHLISKKLDKQNEDDQVI